MSGATTPLPYMSPLNVLSGAEVKNEWSYTSNPLHTYIKWTRTISPALSVV